ncbi:MAG: Glu/Leu/Phe/Val dehydrogenase dimerization domain-containing protein [Burkholderiaceae bacterium]
MFDHAEYRDHESVHAFHDAATGLRALIAVHSTRLGPALGGCRLWHYEHEADALTDVLRLSRGMSLKNAMAELPIGGGKAVLLGPVAPEARRDAFLAFGSWVDSLGGRYQTAEDVGTSVADMQVVAERTRHVGGLAAGSGTVGGDPSPFTALGVLRGIEAAVRAKIKCDSLDGIRVAVQGLGHVGQYLCAELSARGARLVVSDVDPARVRKVCESFGAVPETPDRILAAEADVLAPCALGAVLNRRTITALRVPVVAGAANNQLADGNAGRLLHERGVLYAPDFVINAGGVISVAAEQAGESSLEQVLADIDRIDTRLTEIFERANQENRSTGVVAEDIAMTRIRAGKASTNAVATPARAAAHA